MKIFITGGTGFVGQSLCKQLTADGHNVTVLSRSASRAKDVLGDDVEIIEGNPTVEGNWKSAIDGQDAIINLCGESILAKKWTHERKQILIDSRIISTNNLVAAIEKAKDKPGVLISASAIGIYGDGGSSELTEESGVGDTYGAKLCQDWEAAANSAATQGVRVVTIRTGDVLGKGGILAKMETPFKLYIGGPYGSGKQYTSWIHIDDHISILKMILENDGIKGPVNLISPGPVTSREFAKALGKALNRPSWFPVPKFSLDIIFGQGTELILESKKAIPKRILEFGYKFKFNDIDSALKDIYNN